MGRIRFAVISVVLSVVLPIIGTGAALLAQATYIPTNPVATPTVSPPTMAPMPTVAPPVVTAPTVSASPAGTTGRTGTTGTTGTDATDTSPSGTSASSPLSALSLLGLNSDNALLKALNGTDGDDDSQNALSSLLGSSSTSSDSATLTKILGLLEKEQSRTSEPAAKGVAAKTDTEVNTTGTADKAATKPVTKSTTSGGELVRLAVDGTNLLGGVTMIVSSILAKDGSFLLTGDRTYSSTSGPLSETFYFLCRKNADGSYRLYTDVSQPSAYPFSYLYRLARAGPIRGTRTGDLIVFRRSLSDLSADVVIRVIGATVD